MHRFWVQLRSAVRFSDPEKRERITKAICLIVLMAVYYWSDPEMRPRWPEFLASESLAPGDESDGATGWGIFFYGVFITSIVFTLFLSEEDRILHTLIMLMAIAVFEALGLLYESFWGSHCPAWTFCTVLFQDMVDDCPQREDGYPVLPCICRTELTTVGLR